MSDARKPFQSLGIWYFAKLIQELQENGFQILKFKLWAILTDIQVVLKT
jgi:hypothetical protein